MLRLRLQPSHQPAPPGSRGGGGTEMNQSPWCRQRGAGWAGKESFLGLGASGRGVGGTGSRAAPSRQRGPLGQHPGRGARPVRAGVGVGRDLAWQMAGPRVPLPPGHRLLGPPRLHTVSWASNSPEAAGGQPWAGGRRALVRALGTDSSPLHPLPGHHGAVIPWAPVTASLAPKGSAPCTLLPFPQRWPVLPGHG